MSSSLSLPNPAPAPASTHRGPQAVSPTTPDPPLRMSACSIKQGSKPVVLQTGTSFSIHLMPNPEGIWGSPPREAVQCSQGHQKLL